MKLLVVVDMQNDFIDGVLGSKEAQAIVSNVAKKIAYYAEMSRPIIYTRDSHNSNYMNTQEGQHLPVPHCIAGTKGWEIADNLYVPGSIVDNKPTFGSTNLAKYISSNYRNRFEEIEVVGLCTDICVVSNVLMLKAFFPEFKITVDASCCAGTSIEAHKAALTVMKSCQIEVINEQKDSNE